MRFLSSWKATTLSLGLLAIYSAHGLSAELSGEDLYQQRCAACHNNPANSRAPALEAVKQMSPQALRYTLTQGIMQQQAASLDAEQLNTLVDHLTADQSGGDDWVAGMMCSSSKRTIDLGASVSLPMVGVDHNSSRHFSAEELGLSNADLANLELAWAIGFPKTQGLRSSPVIIGSTMFYTPDPTGKLLAMDTESGCVKWSFDSGAPLRSSITYGHAGKDKTPAVFLAGRTGQLHAVALETGELLWKVDPRHSKRAGITGSPIFFEDRIIVPLSASGVGSAANPKYECCKEHGAVAAVSAVDGKVLWTFHTMEEAKYTGEVNKLGVKLRGPSGAPIWSTPTIDAKRRLVYATTGQNTSLPATETSDAILAIDLDSGELKWGFQALANDVWNLACREPWETSGPNCPHPDTSVLKDYDFGGAAVLAKDNKGNDILVAGQKSGDVWALNPDTGKVIWNQRFGTGTPLGGVHWGIAVDDKRVYAPINDPMPKTANFTPEPGMNALDITTGEVLWRTPVTADCSPERKERYALCNVKFGLSAIPLAIDSSVVSAAIDGRIYIFNGESGEVVWQFDTLREFETLNGIEAHGGGVDSHSVFAGNGMLFIGSGYGGFRQPTGNVLLAFKPKR
ncbi:outer membrane protein assembly factor BamB family protein [Aurantivibrio plasticivorans]